MIKKTFAINEKTMGGTKLNEILKGGQPASVLGNDL
jgi:hypothetical protein